jgi:hypothetical protein
MTIAGKLGNKQRDHNQDHENNPADQNQLSRPRQNSLCNSSALDSGDEPSSPSSPDGRFM